ncbi:MAG: N-6 DNA methylase [Nitrosopumilus sp.]|nr:N-6 DNA methylase [Nitrosopumilus sp.]
MAGSMPAGDHHGAGNPDGVSRIGALEAVGDLVEAFNANLGENMKKQEADIRNEFLNPLFRGLGWDMENRKNQTQDYKDVVVETRIGPATHRKADYAFRIGGVRQFFVEAKKPSENIRENRNHAFQARRYAWNAKKRIIVLTNFRELAVYDCLKKPKRSDRSDVDRIFYCTHEDYADKFDHIWNFFSWDSVGSGYLDRFLEGNIRRSRGSQLVDSAFLEDMESWRTSLAKNLHELNPSLATLELNASLQKTIERILFLRICEDRNIWAHSTLEEISKKNNIYRHMCELYDRADDAFNSGLFDFEADQLSKRLKIGDGVLKKIIKSLYPPASPYDFSILSIDVLGSTYEKFLGREIHIRNNKLSIREKPLVRQSGGVVYTPDFIVTDMVKNTVWETIKGMRPEGIRQVKILDPACGSGTFLVRAYESLLRRHLQFYEGLPLRRRGRYLYTGRDGRLYLKPSIKKEILLNNIYGIDIDHQAVEITKLSLLLKTLEDEMSDPSGFQTTLDRDKRALPDLGRNIVSGNTLIKPDIQRTIDGTENGVNAFDWRTEPVFAGIARSGGFDIVIGNPPYVKKQNLDKNWDRYFMDTYETARGTYDLYYAFIEKSLEMTKAGGLLSFITPNKFLTGEDGAELRTVIRAGASLKRMLHFGANKVFESKASIYACIFTLRKGQSRSFQWHKFNLNDDFKRLDGIRYKLGRNSSLGSGPWLFNTPEENEVLDLIRSGGAANRLDSIFETNKGVSTGNDGIFVVHPTGGRNTYRSRELGDVVRLEPAMLRKFVNGADVGSFDITSDKYVIYPYGISRGAGPSDVIPSEELERRFPLTYGYLSRMRGRLGKRKIGRKVDPGRRRPGQRGPRAGREFYEYSAKRSMHQYALEKIIIPDLLIRNRIGIDGAGEYTFNAGLHGLVPKEDPRKGELLFYLGVLNSEVFWFFIVSTATAMGGEAYRLLPEYFDPFVFPVRYDPKDEACSAMVGRVGQLLQLCRKQKRRKGIPDRAAERRIRYLVVEMNDMVYDMYGLDESQIAVIRGKITRAEPDGA